jgi:hypothetical protein
LATLLPLALLTATAAPCDELAESFDGPLLDPEIFRIDAPAGYDVTLTSGKGLFTKSEGTGNGFARVSTVFTVKGDFVVTVVANRTNAAGDAVIGLASSHSGSGGGFSDVYFRGSGQVISNIFVDPVHEQALLNDSATPVTFRIRRIGNRLIHECDPGFGYIHVSDATDPVLAGPVRISLFLGQENGQTVAHSATFDDLFVQGDAFSPPCGNGVLEDEEVCDDDDPSWLPGEFCNASCAILACGDADDSGAVTATDALFILRTSVGASSCDACVCDVDSSGGGAPTTATDALRVLQKGVGLPGELVCPPCN